jgi:pyruvate dehydrogenase E2 component (dihydrolipoamide acetyltransferase)
MTAAAQTQLFRLPDLGEGLTEAEVLDWKVAVGEAVEVDQIVVEVETAKAVVEVPVPYAGRVLTLHCEPGTVLDVGAPLISVAAVDGAGEPVGTVDGAGERYREEERAGSGNVLIGYGTGHAPATRRRRTRRPGSRAVPTSDVLAPRVISPVVRRLARENGIDVASLTPTGPGGVIRRGDVTAALARRVVQQSAQPPVPSPVAPARESEGTVRIPLRGMRRTVAEKLTRSRAEIPDATTWVDVDATALVNVRNELRQAFPDRPVGLLTLVARICAAGLRRFPELNSSVDAERGEIVRYAHLNLGFAAQTERGLVVPVVHGAHELTCARLQEEMNRLTAQARAGELPPAALTGGTFTLNNYGVFGVDGSTPIINHPEAAILGIGRIVDKPWVLDGALAVRKVTQLSLSFDHRVCDGGVAGGFLRYVADCVERPSLLIADL